MDRDTRRNKSHEFRERYPSLSPVLAGDFHDSDTTDDESNAISIFVDLRSSDRIDQLRLVLHEAQTLMTRIDEDWEIMAVKANRPIRSVQQARDWLTLIMVAWREELSRLERGGSAPA